MEERIVDDPRKIKVKRNAAGGIEDATDALAQEEEVEIETPEELMEFPEEPDEDLVGLAPSDLEKELARRKKEAEEAAAERDKLLAEGEAALTEGRYADAEPFFEQALAYDPTCVPAKKSLWLCRTNGYADTEPLYNEAYAEEFSASDGETKAALREKLGERLQRELAAAEEEAAPLREKVLGAQKERRGAFIANRNYYRLRLAAFGILFCVLIVVMSVCGSGIVHVRDNTFLYLTIAFGALALLDLVPVVIFARKFVVAQRLVSDNEKLSSTEDGAKLEELEDKIGLLSRYLDD